MINLSSLVGVIPASPPALRVVLPGGLVVGGVTESPQANSLAAARAAVSGVNAALAPLGPIFSILDAVLAVKGFADAVPGLITDPSALIQAIARLIQKIDRLVSIIPQLSVPLMARGIIDVVLAVLRGVNAEVQALVIQNAKIDAAQAVADSLEGASRAAMQTIVDASRINITTSRANLAASIEHVQPLVGILSTFLALIGMPPVAVSVDTSGSLDATAASLNLVVQVLTAIRASIP